MNKTILVNTREYTITEIPAVFQLNLSGLGAGVVVGKPSQAVVTITDNDGKLSKMLQV